MSRGEEPTPPQAAPLPKREGKEFRKGRVGLKSYAVGRGRQIRSNAAGRVAAFAGTESGRREEEERHVRFRDRFGVIKLEL